nr:mycothiol system anti-sigma-R factor [Hoyosella rhizosphaerae]
MSIDSDDNLIDEHDVDCSAVMADVYLLLDNECDDAVRSRLQSHLDECGPCLEHFGMEEKIKRLLSRKCAGERAPEHLRERLSIELRRQVTIRRVTPPQ